MRPQTFAEAFDRSNVVTMWGWQPTTEQIAAIAGGAFVCFMEFNAGAVVVSVDGVEEHTVLPNQIGATP